MREVGKVTVVKGDRATVRVDKKDECSKCGMCMFPNNSSFTEFNAVNGVNASVGDMVVIETEKDTKFLGAVLVFLIPLILIGIAMLLNYTLIFNELYTLILSIGLIAIWFVVLALIDKKLKKSYAFCPQVVEIKTKVEENK